MLAVGSLFSGIGGFDLGLERAGMSVKWQVEIDPYCQRVLAKHWPTVTRYGDIRTIDWAIVESIDLLCGGFPCQDLSFAGKRVGINGARSGLWSEYIRAIRALRPRYILVENVPGLLTNEYMGRVLGDLAQSGYDAEWDCIPASAVGAPHRRDRVWIVAYAKGSRARIYDGRIWKGPCGIDGRKAATVADATGERCGEAWPDCERSTEWIASGSDVLEDADSGRLFKRQSERQSQTWISSTGEGYRGHWTIEPDVGRVAYGIPSRVDRLRGLGNAVVPQIAEALGRMILESESQHSSATAKVKHNLP